jgi:hypothetical protein
MKLSGAQFASAPHDTLAKTKIDHSALWLNRR